MATRIDYYPAGEQYLITNHASPVGVAKITFGTVRERGAGGNRLIRNQPNYQVAQALHAHGQIRVPAHTSLLHEAR